MDLVLEAVQSDNQRFQLLLKAMQSENGRLKSGRATASASQSEPCRRFARNVIEFEAIRPIPFRSSLVPFLSDATAPIFFV